MRRVQQERSLHLIIIKVLILCVSDDVRPALLVNLDFTCADLLADPVDGLFSMHEFLFSLAQLSLKLLQLVSL